MSKNKGGVNRTPVIFHKAAPSAEGEAPVEGSETSEHDQAEPVETMTDLVLEGGDDVEGEGEETEELVAEAPARPTTHRLVNKDRGPSGARAKGEITVPPGWVKVIPTVDIPRMRVADRTYSFQRDVKMAVPKDVIPLLIERGIIRPSYR